MFSDSVIFGDFLNVCLFCFYHLLLRKKIQYLRNVQSYGKGTINILLGRENF